jgi:hypothetical protein
MLGHLLRAFKAARNTSCKIVNIPSLSIGMIENDVGNSSKWQELIYIFSHVGLELFESRKLYSGTLAHCDELMEKIWARK